MDYHTKGEKIRSVALFLLPFYKYLSKQPWQFYENEDVENLRMFTQIKEIQEDSPSKNGEEKTNPGNDEGGGDRNTT